ncbi:ABC transporter ATP-binding protein [Xanthobacter oligotrophicus]|uniref:ABC transporter ATP-binding protein n=1 Tax=Xanthobacter oligotrophicus TaxID=2607286 RepID=UPI0011F1A3D2|nr:ABC transporter ATP-binding protein [Xanthobacter oligotrophicus]MCG5237911.1 ABC transporter ATP-binding protein [Xanthobacter oligotrophicus]
MLELRQVGAAYGSSHVLFGIDLSICEGEVVTLMGRNGMGKTSTVNSIMGLLPLTQGEIRFAGDRISGLPPHRIARAGLALVPEGRQVFPNLTVEENLIATAANRGGAASPWTLKAVYDLFPALAPLARRGAGLLSGGEQQMLAVGRALMTNPRLIIFDEATEGLAPKIRAQIWAALQKIRSHGQSVLVIDKNIRMLSRFADRHVILEKGRVVWSGTSGELDADEGISARFLSA